MGFNFDISLSGLIAGQQAISVAQNNISNAQTPSYVRERLEVKSQDATGTGGSLNVGSGVVATQVTRIKDDLLTQQSRNQNSTVQYYTDMSQNLTNVENIFSETSEGSISSLLPKFFDAWNELSKFPEEQSYRTALLGQADQLVQKINQTATGLDGLKTNLDQEIQSNVYTVNDLVQKIADINNKIAKTTGSQPNSLFDQRDQYIDELSKYVDVSTSPNTSNPDLLNVSIGGNMVVTGVDAIKIDAKHGDDTDLWTLSSGDTEIKLSKGSLSSTLELRNGEVESYKKQLDDFTSSLITEVNNIHKSGYGLDNSTGIDFFVGTSSTNIEVNNILKNNPSGVATSSIINTSGNSDIANAISNLKNQNFLAGGTMNPIQYYQAFTIKMASDLNSANNNQNIHESIYNGIEQERQGIQGVNMDEEMSHLMEYERFYQSNAQALKTTNDSFDALLQIL